MATDIHTFFATGNQTKDRFTHRVSRRVAIVTDHLQCIGSTGLGLFIDF